MKTNRLRIGIHLLTLVAVAAWAAPVQARPSKFKLVDKGGKGEKAWKVYRGNRIKNAKDLRWLKKKGVTRVIALENWNHKSLIRAAKKMGVEYVPAFMARGRPGELGRKRLGKNVSDDLAKPGHVTYVYCTYGVHRTGGVIGRFRAERGWSCDAILREARKYGFRKTHYKKYNRLLDWVRKGCRGNTGKGKAPRKGSRKSPRKSR